MDKTRGLRIALAGLLFGMGMLSMVLMLIRQERPEQVDAPDVTYSVGLSLAGMLALSYFILSPRIRSWFYPKQKLGMESTYAFSEAGLHVISPVGSSKCLWGAFLKWSETRSFVLIYTYPNLALFIPKDSVDSPEDLGVVRNILTRTLPRR